MTFSILPPLLALSACALAFWAGCASQQVNTRFDAQWEFLENDHDEVKACMSEAKVEELRRLLVRCGEGLE